MTDYSKMSDEEINALVAETLGDDYETFVKVSAELTEESARASVIVGAAWLDDILAALIEQALPDDEQVRNVFTNPFRTFGYRIETAYRLELICQKEKEGLDVVRKIRKEFAHEILASFNDSKVKDLVSKLEPIISLKVKPMEDLRDYYVYAVARLHTYLNARVKSVREITDMTKRLHKMRWLAERRGEELEGKDKS